MGRVVKVRNLLAWGGVLGCVAVWEGMAVVVLNNE